MRKESVILEREKVVEERLEVDDIIFYEVGNDGHLARSDTSTTTKEPSYLSYLIKAYRWTISSV